MWLAVALSVRPAALRSSSWPSARVAFTVALRSSGGPVSVARACTRPETRGSSEARLRQVEPRLEIGLVAAKIAVEPRRAMRSGR